MRKRLRLGAFILFFSAGAVCAGTIPYGVQNDVSTNTVLNDWGWEIIYWDAYAANTSIETLFAGLETGDHVMLAGIQEGSMNFDVLAATSFGELTTVTSANQTHFSNGVEWYFNGLSMGFAGAGDLITQGSADTTGLTERDRLSWHTSGGDGSAPVFVNGGWRSGDQTGLSGSYAWNKVVLKYSVIPEPSTIAFVGIFGGGLWFVRRYFPRI